MNKRQTERDIEMKRDIEREIERQTDRERVRKRDKIDGWIEAKSERIKNKIQMITEEKIEAKTGSERHKLSQVQL